MNIACYIRNSTIYDQVKTALVRAGFFPSHFDSETSLLRTLKRKNFDFVIIDLGSASDTDSIFSWLSLRSGDAIPTLLLSPTRNGELVARALDSGADDFLERPFEAVELLARINAIVRRASPAANRRSIDYIGFQLHRDSAKFSYQGRDISLTPREFSMAWLFFSSPGVYISRETLGAVIWSADSEIAGRTIEQHVYKLRKKLQVEGRQIVVIRTAYSHGYRLEPVSGAQDAADMGADTAEPTTADVRWQASA
ncbi:response regulator transcription factor [Herbaspirillum sp. YR522]|uniref:response regulator transcription factor n=1 Tax=Herbaspirillum sp. YR522 TaxID=1144342 RepID=UPI00026F887E|nr:response regulator transcription factor [Herbaspirillum sp. YR522]EJN02900.1 response regulator with CheY-like receiver domain and winged-helix DNA-binding domain [Herbaspirillum sp. YR522]